MSTYEFLTLYEPARSLRSSSRALLAVSKSRLKTEGDRAVSVRGPQTLEQPAGGDQTVTENLFLQKSFYSLSCYLFIVLVFISAYCEALFLLVLKSAV